MESDIERFCRYWPSKAKDRALTALAWHKEESLWFAEHDKESSK